MAVQTTVQRERMTGFSMRPLNQGVTGFPQQLLVKLAELRTKFSAHARSDLDVREYGIHALVTDPDGSHEFALGNVGERGERWLERKQIAAATAREIEDTLTCMYMKASEHTSVAALRTDTCIVCIAGSYPPEKLKQFLHVLALCAYLIDMPRLESNGARDLYDLLCT